MPRPIAIPCQPGDKLGYLYKSNDKWTLLETEIKEIRIGPKGAKISKTKDFYALDVEEVVSNTEIFKSLQNGVITRKVFLLDDELRERTETWIEHMNAAQSSTAEPVT